MSFPYNKSISIFRAPTGDSINDHNYEGRIPPLTEIFTALPCSIQRGSQTSKPITGLPQSSSNDTYWTIFIPRQYANDGDIVEHDIGVDNTSKRYEIVGAWWDELGYNLLGKLLKT